MGFRMTKGPVATLYPSGRLRFNKEVSQLDSESQIEFTFDYDKNEFLFTIVPFGNMLINRAVYGGRLPHRRFTELQTPVHFSVPNSPDVEGWYRCKLLK